ncbi:MAG: YggS family pyridoxal phosphate-dependent enzyme [Prevotellaceae bacterium]|nr:YggS family pyridoxal phosphate-dependent enzyme [Prevotellaceae bacterium]
MVIAQKIQIIKNNLPPRTALVAVSKTQPVEVIRKAYAAGQRAFGESRPQALRDKASKLPADIEWHFIGHLQSNKIKLVVGLAHTIHSADSKKLLVELNKEAERQQCTQRCLLQVHVAQEETKYGFTPGELRALAAAGFLAQLPCLQIAGLMGMATFTNDTEQIRREFRTLKNLYTELKQTYFSTAAAFCELSMGMSNDYSIAVAEGSTIVRIGKALFED